MLLAVLLGTGHSSLFHLTIIQKNAICVGLKSSSFQLFIQSVVLKKVL